MKIQQRSLKRHLFICVNERDCGQDCHEKGALRLVRQLKTMLREKGLWDRYKVSKAGCLGGCAFGITATMYPDNTLISQIQQEDAQKLLEMMVQDPDDLY